MARVVDLVERLANLLAAEQRRTAAVQGLQPVHAQALHYLARCNRYSNTPAAVAEYLGLTKGTVSQSLRILERRGLIARRRDPTDRRVVRLRLTAKGARLAAELAAPAPWRDLPGDEAGPALERLLRTVQQRNRSRTFGVCASCRFFQSESETAFRCGLTGEPLSASDAVLICREHEPTEVAVG